MTVNSYPWQTHPLVSTAQWSDMAARFRGDGIIPNADNQFSVYADSTGMRVKVQTGRAFLRGIYIHNDAEALVSVGSANPSNPRIDAIVLRVDWVNEAVTLACVAGTPAATPTPPEITNSTTIYEFLMAYVTVDAAAVTIAEEKVEDKRKHSWAQAASSVGLILALS